MSYSWSQSNRDITYDGETNHYAVFQNEDGEKFQVTLVIQEGKIIVSTEGDLELEIEGDLELEIEN